MGDVVVLVDGGIGHSLPENGIGCCLLGEMDLVHIKFDLICKYCSSFIKITFILPTYILLKIDFFRCVAFRITYLAEKIK